MTMPSYTKVFNQNRHSHSLDRYNDYEGFSFPVSGPYWEFPILSSHEVYSGGRPGADRVIFNDNGGLAGLITHQGASGNDFLQCS
jgi:ribonuclease T1